jgi:hypothetical protein
LIDLIDGSNFILSCAIIAVYPSNTFCLVVAPAALCDCLDVSSDLGTQSPEHVSVFSPSAGPEDASTRQPGSSARKKTLSGISFKRKNRSFANRFAESVDVRLEPSRLRAKRLPRRRFTRIL